MNLLIPHTVLVISAKRIRLDWLKPARILGPGIFHYEGDLRARLRTLSQTKAVARGFVEVRFQSGDTVQVLKDLLVEAAQDPGDSDAGVARQNARLEFIYGLAGLAGVNLESNVKTAPVGNLESGEVVPPGPPTAVPDGGTHGDLVEGLAADGKLPDAAAVAAALEAAARGAAPEDEGLGDDEEIVVSDADTDAEGAPPK